MEDINSEYENMLISGTLDSEVNNKIMKTGYNIIISFIVIMLTGLIILIMISIPIISLVIGENALSKGGCSGESKDMFEMQRILLITFIVLYILFIVIIVLCISIYNHNRLEIDNIWIDLENKKY